MFKLYKFENNQILPIELELWAEWFQNTDRKILFSRIGLENVEVSTVFMSVDNGYSCPPRLFETLISFGQFHGETFAASSIKEAKRNHRRACRMVLTGIPPEDRIRPEHPQEEDEKTI